MVEYLTLADVAERLKISVRHSTASLLVNAGASLYVVGQILGHTTTQTTQRYAHLEDDAKRAAIDRI